MTESGIEPIGRHNVAVISFGSNVSGQRHKNIVEACGKLIARTGSLKSAESLIHPTAPLNPRHSPYLNYVVALDVPLFCDCLSCERLCKQIETEAGRTSLSKAIGEMPLDVDLLFWNNRMIRPCAPPLPYLVPPLSEVMLQLKGMDNICRTRR